jgi:hypothetical protein
LCRDGVEIAEIRRRRPKRRVRTLAADPRFAVSYSRGYRPDEPLDRDEWPER